MLSPRYALRAMPAAGLLLCSACTHRRPETAAGAPVAVAEGSAVRLRVVDGSWRDGRATTWTAGRARVVPAAGDTVAVACDMEVETPLAERGDNRWQGALVGMLAGWLELALSCGGQQYCGEENPIPALTVITGYFVGRNIPRTQYLAVPVPGCGVAPPR